MEGASAKINELRRSFGDFGSQSDPNQNGWRGSNRHRHGGRGREIIKDDEVEVVVEKRKGRGNLFIVDIYQCHFRDDGRE